MKKWDEKTPKEREDILRKLNYTFPDILAKRKWVKLSKKVKADFKKLIS